MSRVTSCDVGSTHSMMLPYSSRSPVLLPLVAHTAVQVSWSIAPCSTILAGAGRGRTYVATLRRALLEQLELQLGVDVILKEN